MRFPSYISKSRHGIYYVRVVTPKAVRLAYPALPKEVRKSLNTRCPREAAVRSRRLALDWRILVSVFSGAMSNNDNFTGQFSVTTDPATGKVTYQFDKGDSVSEAKEYIMLLQQLGQLPMNANAFDIMGHEHPTPQQLLDARLEVKAVKPGGIWLSDLAQAFGDEMLKTNAWKTPNTWTQTYRPILRDFRDIVSRSKRTITHPDGREEAIWDNVL